jgi:hypothetical protein
MQYDSMNQYSDPTRTRPIYTSPPFHNIPTPNRSLTFPLAPRPACLNLSGINTPHIPTLVILHRLAYEDGTDRGFRNVGYQYLDAGKTPRRKYIILLSILAATLKPIRLERYLPRLSGANKVSLFRADSLARYLLQCT